MELSKEQIQRIHKYLDVKGVKFIDFKIEILDHIISQIEEEINNGKSFDRAFTHIKLKWNSELRSSHSWIFGAGFIAPRIVIKKAKKIFTTYFLLLSTPLLVAFLIVINSKILLSEVIGYSIVYSTITLLSITAFYSFKIRKSKEKTVYSFIVKTQFINFIFIPLFLISNTITDFISIGFLGYMIITTYAFRLFYLKHQQEKERYKLLLG